MTKTITECLSHNQGLHYLGSRCTDCPLNIQPSPEHPWDEVLGAGEVLGSGREGGCPFWEDRFLAEHGTAAALAGRQGGHLCAPVNEGSLHSGGCCSGIIGSAKKRAMLCATRARAHTKEAAGEE